MVAGRREFEPRLAESESTTFPGEASPQIPAFAGNTKALLSSANRNLTPPDSLWKTRRHSETPRADSFVVIPAKRGNPATSGAYRFRLSASLRPESQFLLARDDIFPQPALMFAFKGSDAIICFRSGGKGRLGGAHSRRQDPKTPVEHALMRGLVTA